MKLSIITINFNDLPGLQRTVESVLSQTARSLIEYIVIDGGSTDGSADYLASISSQLDYWHSKPDKGIYNAMNIGIQHATGDYIQILNSADILASANVVEQMQKALEDKGYPEILYGNMLKAYPDGKKHRDTCGGDLYTPQSFLYFYKGTLNHDCAWIKRSLFVPDNQQSAISNKQCYGLYDEDLKICSDWKWYVNAIALGGIHPLYVNIDVTIFDMNGVSESGGKNKSLIQNERRAYLEQILPASVLRDYDTYCFPMEQYRRLRRHHLWPIVYFLERVIFKLEKWGVLR